MFTLSAFDMDLARQRQQRENAPWRRLARALMQGDGTDRMIAVCVLAGGLLFASLTEPTSVTTTPPPLVTADMTFNGMTLTDFARRMDMPADDPYLIAMFAALCATEEAAVGADAMSD